MLAKFADNVLAMFVNFHLAYFKRYPNCFYIIIRQLPTPGFSRLVYFGKLPFLNSATEMFSRSRFYNEKQKL